MKILISVDIEGIAGVMHSEQTRPGNPEYEQARRWMTAEANAAVQGAFEGGATEVVVADSHGGFRNLILDALDSRARIVTGKPRYLSMVAGVAGCNAAFFIGYHSGASHPGVLAHTISSFAFSRVAIDGVEFNEAKLYGALAAAYGVPVALLAGDDVFIAETQSSFPGAVSVETKKAEGRAACLSLSPAESSRQIRIAARRAVEIVPQLKLQPASKTSLVCEVQTQNPGLADLFCQWPSLRRVDGVTLRFDASNIEELIRILNCLSAMSYMLK